MFDKIKNAFNSLMGNSKVEAEEVAPEVEMAAEVTAEPVAEEAKLDAPEAAELTFKERARHVVAEGSGWAVKKPGNSEALEVHAKKQDAIDAAIAMCKELKGELFIHRKDGKIQSRNSYGKDSKKRKG